MSTTHNQTRQLHAKEAFRNAHETIGDITPGMNLFAITRGQFGMIDTILACLDQTGPAAISVWTWCIAEYEVQCFDRLRQDERITEALLVIDHSAQKRNAKILDEWRAAHGPKSVKVVLNHSKIATVQNDRFRLLIRGSFNLNYNPRFEQLDISEGCPGFDLVKRIEADLPVLPSRHTYADLRRASKLDNAFDAQQLMPFEKLRTWAK